LTNRQDTAIITGGIVPIHNFKGKGERNMKKKETPETKRCKHCQTEIPYEAKVCPQCKKRVKGGKLKWVVIALVVLVVIGVAAGGGEEETKPQKVGEVSASSTVAETTADVQQEVAAAEETAAAVEAPTSEDAPEETQQTEFRVGDILQDGDTKIVYMSSGVYTEENTYSQPAEGYQYIYLQLAFENTSDTQDTSISMFSFDCYADGYAMDAYYGGDEDLSATLSPGRTTTGYLYFTVPVDAQEIEVEYTTNFITEEKITFLYEGAQDSGYVPETNAAATEGAYQVGDIVESDSLIVTYLSCEEYISDNSFVQPREGYHYITCTFEFENQSQSDEYISSMDFDCYADGVSCDATYIRDDDLSATLSSGRKTQGTVTFEVPLSATVVEVEYLTNYWTSNRLVFQAG
jgi:hypothetical protein